MPTLLLRFPGRRYHATPWGHHVNEGLIEWPPSPWRLLRALLATGYAKLHWPAAGPSPVARSLVEKLASVLPHYGLPAAVGTHTRHYMPLARFKNGREETTLVFDTWAQVDEGVLAVRWDVELNAAESDMLAHLVRLLGYLGRSESWIEGEMVGDGASVPPALDVVPCEDGFGLRPGWEQVALPAALPPAAYITWRERALREAIDSLPKENEKGKALTKAAVKKNTEALEANYPVDIIAALQVETAWLHRLGWSQPPGTRRVLYWRRSDSLESTAPRPKSQVIRAAPVECMLLAMATATGNVHALPAITRVVPQAELLHRALNAHASRIAGHSVVLSGSDATGKPLTTPHSHAHLLHLDLDNDGRLDHVLIWAPMGLDTDAQAAVRAVRRTFTKRGIAPLRVALAASGSSADIARLPAPLGDRVRALLGGSRLHARSWRSLTPFVPPRHLKKNGRNSLVGQINAELQGRGLPVPASVVVLDPHGDESARRARHFVRARRLGPAPPVDCGFTVELRFAEPVPGPIVLGYGCHFGLGVFAAEEPERHLSDDFKLAELS